ncbi:hypothetical protein TNCV_2472311 [Trichonephila clavipes]|nr:hypothetical protein TNCV_2472311 [Trichonephila clavipes]
MEKKQKLIGVNDRPLRGRSVSVTALRPLWGASRRKRNVADPRESETWLQRVGSLLFIADFSYLKIVILASASRNAVVF